MTDDKKLCLCGCNTNVFGSKGEQVRNVCPVCWGDAFDHVIMGGIIFWCDNNVRREK